MKQRWKKVPAPYSRTLESSTHEKHLMSIVGIGGCEVLTLMGNLYIALIPVYFVRWLIFSQHVHQLICQTELEEENDLIMSNGRAILTVFTQQCLGCPNVSRSTLMSTVSRTLVQKLLFGSFARR